MCASMPMLGLTQLGQLGARIPICNEYLSFNILSSYPINFIELHQQSQISSRSAKNNSYCRLGTIESMLTELTFLRLCQNYCHRPLSCSQHSEQSIRMDVLQDKQSRYVSSKYQKNHQQTLNCSKSLPMFQTVFKQELWRFASRSFYLTTRWFQRSFSRTSILLSLSTTSSIFVQSPLQSYTIFQLGSCFCSICADSFSSCSWIDIKLCSILVSSRLACDYLNDVTGVRFFLGMH